MKEQFAKLINVKSLITLVLTCVFAYLAGIQVINAEQVITIFTTVIAFYFGTQHEKKI